MNSTPSQQPGEQIERASVSRLMTGAVILLGVAIAGAGILSGIQTAELDNRESEWGFHQAEFLRLSRAEERLMRMEAAQAELDGSWQRDLAVGDLFSDFVERFPASFAVGKISMGSSYDIDSEEVSEEDTVTPYQCIEAMIAARCFADPAEPEILSLLSTLQNTKAITSEVELISLGGIQKNEGRVTGIAPHTVFALRLTLPSRSLIREAP